MKTVTIPPIIQEVAIVYKRPVIHEMRKLTTSQGAYEIMLSFVDHERIDLKEFFWVILLSRSNYVLGISEIGSGSLCGVQVNHLEIFQLAICANASQLVLVHNHPSGRLEPITF